MGFFATYRSSDATMFQPAFFNHWLTVARSFVSVRKRLPWLPSGISSASSGSTFCAPASIASPSGSRDLSVCVASTTPNRSKKKLMLPGCPSWPARKMWRTSEAVRFRLSVRHSTITGTLWGAKPSYSTVSYSTFSSSSPAPFLIARSIVSRYTLAFRAFSTATCKRGFMSGSAPPSFAATMISRTILPTICPFF